MKFNTKTRYGLRTMLEVAINSNCEEGILQKDIAVNQNVSVKYLDQIIAALKAAGLIINVGGKKSGYCLNKLPEEITIYDVYRAFDDELAIIDCLLTGSDCPGKEKCVLKDFWCGLNQTLREGMESMNLKKLAENHRKTNKIRL